MKKNIPVIFFLGFTMLSVILFTTTGCVKNTTPNLTVVATIQTTNAAINVGSESVISGGYITYNGGATVTANGVCWSSTNTSPTIADSKKVDSVVEKTFVSNINGLLLPSTTYYIRAFATNSNGTGYGNVIKFTTLPSNTYPPTGTVTTFAGSLGGGYANGTGTAAQFSSPQAIAVDASGNMYVADSYNNVIRKVTPAGVVTTLAGSGTLGYANGTGTAAQFYSPEGIAVDASGNVYVADFGNNAIRKITPAGVVTTLAGNGYAGYADGTGGLAVFKAPHGVAVDGKGNVYVADQGNNLIRMVTSAGVVTTLSGVVGGGYVDSTGVTTALRFPSAIAVDAAGANLYITDQNNHAIRQYNVASTALTTLIGNPTQTTILNAPTGITTDATGNLYFVDSFGKIMEYNATSKGLYTLAGTAGTYSFADGIGTAAQFNSPQGLTVYQGVLYVVDSGNNLIRKITIK